jgi:hypothetical protein
LGIEELSRQWGFRTGASNNGWSHDVYMVTPGLPGDSGSGYLGSNGGALGVLSALAVVLANNEVTDLTRALNYMKQYTDLDGVQLANGTVRFNPLI